MQKIRNLFKHEEGFTLIELLVVIAVLGILAAIAIPRLGGVTDRARMTEATGAAGSIKTALEMNSTENERLYPGDGDYETSMPTFNEILDLYVDDYTPDDGDEVSGTWNDWDVTYNPDATVETNTGDGVFTVELTQGDYIVTLERDGSKYLPVDTNVSN